MKSRVSLGLLALVLLAGCHAKFKKYAPTLGQVSVQTVTTGMPYVNLGKASGGDTTAENVAATVVNVVQAAKEVDQTRRLAQAVRIQDVNAALEAGFAETLGGGPPFALVSHEAPARVQLEVLDYGLNVPFIGAPGEFTYTVRVRIYTAGGERVYSSRSTCSTAAGAPTGLASALGVVNNVRQLKDLTDEQINEAFTGTAHWCGSLIVTRMRKHAG